MSGNLDAKERARLDCLSLELATEAELEAVATLAALPWRRAEARALALARARELATRAARQLAAGLDHAWPEWRQAA